ncbi:MAG: 3'(2'),5'-bisphosphate nucleotidase CysQ [Parvibaculales bacterium]
MTKCDVHSPTIITALCRLAVEAGINAMRHYHAGVEIEQKDDDSPVTLADREGEDIITHGLRHVCPDFQIIGEESFHESGITELEDCFFLLDPLDGTKEFINKKTDFTVNIGLVEHGRPVAGIVYAPALEQLYFTCGDKAFFMDLAPEPSALETLDISTGREIKTRTADEKGLVVVASRSHRTLETDDYLATLPVKELVSAGSSLKFCLIAKGEADIYPRFGRTMEWDTAAAHAVLLAAGGSVEDVEGNTLGYGKMERGLDNPFFIARA